MIFLPAKAWGAEVANASIANDRRLARVRMVDEHDGCENAHDLEGGVRTFGDTARYDDEPWGEHHEGPTAVRRFYEQILQALPDLNIQVERRHVTDEVVLLEVTIRGTHLGRLAWSSRHREKSRIPAVRGVHL
jgi:hypothetical protein